MSETQRRVTGSFQAVDDNGIEYSITEYTKFEHTTTLETATGDESEGVKEYEAGAGSPLNRISDTEFEMVADGTRLRKI